MNSMVSNPLDRVVLHANRLENHEKNFEGFVGFVTSMSPKTVSAGWNAEGGDETEDEIWGKISKVKS
jgi:hypothetical protein